MRLTKKISRVITLPDVWEWNPLDDDGEPILRNPVKYELGPGKIKVFSLSQEEKCAVMDASTVATVTGGQAAFRTTEKAARENQIVARLGGENGSWSGFESADGEPLNCTTKNQAKFAHHEGLRIFVLQHVGPMLDAEAEGRATEEEKNSLKLLCGTQGDESESGKIAKSAKNHGKSA